MHNFWYPSKPGRGRTILASKQFCDIFVRFSFFFWSMFVYHVEKPKLGVKPKPLSPAKAQAPRPSKGREELGEFVDEPLSLAKRRKIAPQGIRNELRRKGAMSKCHIQTGHNLVLQKIQTRWLSWRLTWHSTWKQAKCAEESKRIVETSTFSTQNSSKKCQSLCQKGLGRAACAFSSLALLPSHSGGAYTRRRNTHKLWIPFSSCLSKSLSAKFYKNWALSLVQSFHNV